MRSQKADHHISGLEKTDAEEFSSACNDQIIYSKGLLSGKRLFDGRFCSVRILY